MNTENYNQLISGYNSVLVNPNKSPLEELRALREFAKAVDNAIKAVSDEATQLALQLAPNGGQFTHEGHTYQLQLTRKYDFTDYKRYKGPEACAWRDYAGQKKQLQDKSKALTKIMDGLAKSYATENEDKEPDEITAVVKCID